MLRLYQRRFGVEDVAHVVFSLSYFEDAEREEMPEMLWPVGWDENQEHGTRLGRNALMSPR